jgi:hypothetical protein
MATISGVLHVLLVFLGAFRCRCATTYSCSSGDIHLLVCESKSGSRKVRVCISPKGGQCLRNEGDRLTCGQSGRMK